MAVKVRSSPLNINQHRSTSLNSVTKHVQHVEFNSVERRLMITSASL